MMSISRHSAAVGCHHRGQALSVEKGDVDPGIAE